MLRHLHVKLIVSRCFENRSRVELQENLCPTTPWCRCRQVWPVVAFQREGGEVPLYRLITPQCHGIALWIFTLHCVVCGSDLLLVSHRKGGRLRPVARVFAAFCIWVVKQWTMRWTMRCHFRIAAAFRASKHSVQWHSNPCLDNYSGNRCFSNTRRTDQIKAFLQVSRCSNHRAKAYFLLWTSLPSSWRSEDGRWRSVNR